MALGVQCWLDVKHLFSFFGFIRLTIKKVKATCLTLRTNYCCQYDFGDVDALIISHRSKQACRKTDNLFKEIRDYKNVVNHCHGVSEFVFHPLYVRERVFPIQFKAFTKTYIRRAVMCATIASKRS